MEPAQPTQTVTTTYTAPPGRSPVLPTLLGLLSLLLLLSTGYLGYQNMQLQKQVEQLSTPLSTPTPTSDSKTPSNDPTENWKIYTNKKYSFEIKYPETYKIVSDPSGWPNAVAIISRPNRQSYDLVIEAWASESEYLAEYQYKPSGRIALKQSGSTILTLLNNNVDEEVDLIISTFKFTTPSIKKDKKLGYIKKIEWARGDTYSLNIDYIDYVSDDTAPNHYRIDNPSPELVTLPIAKDPPVIMQTYSRRDDGDYHFNEIIPFSVLVALFSSTANSPLKNVPYWIETENGTVITIIEQYLP